MICGGISGDPLGRSGPARRSAILGAGRRVDHLELLAGQHIVTLVSDDVDDGAAGALVGLVHQQLHFKLAAPPIRSLSSDLLAGMVLIFSGIGEDRNWTHRRRRACRQKPAGQETVDGERDAWCNAHRRVLRDPFCVDA